jgi:glycosyltransferase involved in cell wall biosynthesis
MLSAADLAVVCLDTCFSGLSVPSKSYGVIASGTPLLGMLDPGSEIGQLITETACGLVICEPSAKQIAAAIQELSEHPARCRAMADAGRRAFLERYTLAHAARAYDTALTALIRAG